MILQFQIPIPVQGMFTISPMLGLKNFSRSFLKLFYFFRSKYKSYLIYCLCWVQNRGERLPLIFASQTMMLHLSRLRPYLKHLVKAKKATENSNNTRPNQVLLEGTLVAEVWIIANVYGDSNSSSLTLRTNKLDHLSLVCLSCLDQ